MALIELKAKRSVTNTTKEKVRIAFPIIRDKNKNPISHLLIVSIGKNVANEIGAKQGDKVKFFYEEDNLNIWVIKKSLDQYGFKLTGNPKSNAYKIQLTAKLFIPNNDEILTHDVKHDLHQGGIRIFRDYF